MARDCGRHRKDTRLDHVRILAASLFFVLISSAPLSADEFIVTEPPKTLGTPLNSTLNDFAPTVSRDGSFMVFNSNRGGKYQDLYISRFDDGKWGAPEPLAGLNSPYNDETPFLSGDGEILIFSSDRDGSIEMPKDSLGRIRVSYDLYWSRKIGDTFGTPVPVPGHVNTAFHEKTPSLSLDSKTLYFTKYSFGKLEDSRMMTSEFKNGTFTMPQLMPEPFNSGHQDLALIPAEDLKGFFFSSNRPGGYGKWDLYFVSYLENKFGDPANLGELVNSEESDVYLARADQRFFLCSTRPGGSGMFDIYSSFVFKKDASFETRAIHFDYNQFSIKKESYPYLDALSDFLKKNESLSLEIIGHTDLHGTDEYNNGMSLKRAEAVKNYLGLKGIPPGRFRVTGAGKSQPVVNKTGKGYDELNRRTEFRIIKQ